MFHATPVYGESCQFGSVLGSVAVPTVMLRVIVDPVQFVETFEMQTPSFTLGEQARGSV
jgi:hypothetical protein